jgi:ribonuclease BN (tRNA processing enzyme)
LIVTHILASPSIAGRIAAQASVRRLVLTHIREKSDILLQTMINDAAFYFAGEINVAQDLLQIEL